MKDIPEYWKSKEMFSSFNELCLEISNREIVFNEDFSDAQINKNLTQIENRVEKELKRLNSVAVNSIGVTANGIENQQ